MIAKLFEIRDIAKFIPVMAINIDDYDNQEQKWLLSRAGFVNVSHPSVRYILLCRINIGGGESRIEPYQWTGRTMVQAHKYIVENWNQLEDGDVIDVEFILGETRVMKISERLPTVYPRKGDWVEFGTQVAAKTDAEHAADNALCNAAYLAKKPE